MKVIGITGGIASGKSHVLSKLKELGAVVLDADALVKELSCPGGAVNKAVADEFGQEYICDDGTVDKDKLRQKVFSDENELMRLNKATAMVIREALDNRIMELKEEKLVFVEGVRIFEEEFRDVFAEIWFVCCEEKEQLKRLMARDGISLQQAQNTLERQSGLMSCKEKADVIIETDGSISELYKRIEKIYGEVK